MTMVECKAGMSGDADFRFCASISGAQAARGRAVALRVRPLPKAQRLDSSGRPILTQYGQAGVAGACIEAAARSRSRARVSQGLGVPSLTARSRPA